MQAGNYMAQDGAQDKGKSAALIPTSISDSYKLCPQTFYKPHVHYL